MRLFLLCLTLVGCANTTYVLRHNGLQRGRYETMEACTEAMETLKAVAFQSKTNDVVIVSCIRDER